jgi:hypothetical protein
MRIERKSGPNHLEKRTGAIAVASFAQADELEDWDLRETLNHIVIGTATFHAFREALASFRGQLH